MKRRKFLSQVSGLAAATVAGSTLADTRRADATSTGNTDFDVAIVGGGFAGVTAARDCAKNGYKTVLLEARDRLGGRTWTAQFDGESIEYGGTWIYNCQPFVWTEVERYGLEIEETPGAVPDQMVLIADGERTVMDEVQLMQSVTAWMQFTEGVRSIVPRPYDLMHNSEAALTADAISADAHLESLSLAPMPHAFCKGIVELIASGGADSISYLDVLRLYMLGGAEFSNFMDSAARFKLKDGTSGLIDRIAEDAGGEFRLSTPVKAIEDHGDHVRVLTQHGDTIRARAAVCTVPMNVLADISLKPPLPSPVLNAARERHPGQGAKLFLKVEGQAGNVATIAPGRPLNYMMTFEQTQDYTLLVAFSSEPSLIDANDRNALQKELEVHLPGVRLQSNTSHDWNSDPYARGTWATYRPGWARTLLPLFQKNSGRVHFASGDHGEGWRGTIDGAIGAGTRTSHAIRQQLG